MKPVQAPDVTPPADAQAEAGQAPDETEWLEVRDVRVEEVAGGRRVIISLTRPPESVLDFTTTAPPRLILDLGGPRLRGPMPVTRFPLADPLVSQVRVGSHDGTLRAVVDLSKDPGTHTVRQEDTRVIVDLGDTLVSEAPAAADAQGAAPTGEGPPAEGPRPRSLRPTPARRLRPSPRRKRRRRPRRHRCHHGWRSTTCGSSPSARRGGWRSRSPVLPTRSATSCSPTRRGW
jgi:hypothetical protein